MWELAVLSLVREEPMHPYLMQRLLRERHKDEVLVLKRGSLYHAIQRLVRAGWIEAAEVGRDGRRPERTVYRITPDGQSALLNWLKQRIAVPHPSASDFMGSLSFLVHLPPRDALEQLQTRAMALQKQITGTEQALREVSRFVDRINLVESEYSLAMAKAERRWVMDLVAELRGGKLTWNLREILKQVRAARRKIARRKESSHD